jgi:broad specificity phosphatase PhoE
MSELIVVRHARSLYNLRKTTDLDSGISEFGKTQATGVGKFLAKKFKPNAFEGFVSPFLRCLETAKLIQDELGIPFRVIPNLSEHLELDQKVTVPYRKEFGFNWHFGQGIPTYEPYEFAAQKNIDFIDRINSARKEIKNSAQILGKIPLIITHGTPKATLIKLETESSHQVPVWDFSYDNCSITWIKEGRVLWNGRNLHHEPEAGH